MIWLPPIFETKICWWSLGLNRRGRSDGANVGIDSLITPETSW